MSKYQKRFYNVSPRDTKKIASLKQAGYVVLTENDFNIVFEFNSKHLKAAEAVKDWLIKLAESDNLPLDLNNLDVSKLTEVIYKSYN